MLSTRSYGGKKTMTNLPILHSHTFTQIEFGHMHLVFEALQLTRTKKPHDLQIRSVKNFLRSLQQIGRIKSLPRDFEVVQISKQITGSFPSEISFKVTIVETGEIQ